MPDNHYATDVSDAVWTLLAPLLPAAQPGGRPRSTDVRAVINAIFYLLHRLSVASPSSRVPSLGHRVSLFPYVEKLRRVDMSATGNHEQVRRKAGLSACSSVVIMDGQSVKTTERGGVRGFDGHKLVKGQKRHILVDTLGLPIACRVEPANTSDRRAADLLLSGLSPLFPDIRTVIADAGHESGKLARQLLRNDGWKLKIVKRQQRAFKITGLTWIVERTFAWLGRNRRFSKDYEYMVQTSETLIDIAAIRIMLNRLAQG